jgi:hypothetical protein
MNLRTFKRKTAPVVVDQDAEIVIGSTGYRDGKLPPQSRTVESIEVKNGQVLIVLGDYIPEPHFQNIDE